MDRSFLSSTGVIEASREFVCIRTATYEDAEEAEFLRSMIFGGAEDLRNFGFCILSPDASKAIRVSNRGPNFVYSDASELAEDLRRIAKKNTAKPSKKSKLESPKLPQMKSFRLGLNVASCDGLPLVALVGENQKDLEQMTDMLTEVIWDDELMGKFIYASTLETRDLSVISGAKSKSGILLIDPNEYGTEGRLLEAIELDISTEDLKAKLLKAADRFKRDVKSHGLHVRNGRRAGETWETEVPVPDRRRSRDNDRSSNRQRRNRSR